MSDLKETVRRRIDAGEDVSKIRSELASEGHPEEGLDRAIASYDWRAELRQAREDGTLAAYQKKLDAHEQSAQTKKVLVLVAGLFLAFFMLSFLGIIGVVGAIAVVAITIMTYNSV